MKGLNMMYSYQGKVAGLVVAAVGLVALLIQKFTDFTFINKLDSGQHFNLLLFITLLGLYTIMFSREKIEDERVQAIRTRSLFYAFMLLIGVTLAYAMVVSLEPTTEADMANGANFTRDQIVERGRMMMFYPAVGMVLYLLMFHIGLYFDSAWDYDNKPLSLRGLWEDKRYRLGIKIVAIIIIWVILKLIR